MTVEAQRAAEVRALLATMLDRRFGRPRRIRAIEHRPSLARSSFALEDFDVVLDDGELLRLVLKALGARGLLSNASLAKPLYLHDPLREIEFYRHVLAERPHLGTATLYSTVVEAACDRYWLLLERAPGPPLDRVADLEGWCTVARWLAHLHAELAPLAPYPSAPGVTRLLRCDADFLRMWVVRALSIVRGQGTALPAAQRVGMERLAGRYDRVAERLASLPETILHGEFHPSNILLDARAEVPRVCPVDWEMAAVGPHLLDLAALLAGETSEERRREIAMAYRAALPEDVRRRTSEEGFMEDLAYCRLHLAVQWLGGSPASSPPIYRTLAWLDDVLRLAGELGL